MAGISGGERRASAERHAPVTCSPGRELFPEVCSGPRVVLRLGDREAASRPGPLPFGPRDVSPYTPAPYPCAAKGRKAKGLGKAARSDLFPVPAAER